MVFVRAEPRSIVMVAGMLRLALFRLRARPGFDHLCLHHGSGDVASLLIY